MSMQAFLLTACSGNYGNLSRYNISYDAGEHIIVRVNSDYNFLGLGKVGKYVLESPVGYKVIACNYDLFELKNNNSSSFFNYYDYVYVNAVPVIASDSNDFGEPTEEVVVKKDGNLYGPGEHVIEVIERKIDLLWGRDNFLADLKSPVGYEVIDYGYGKTSVLEFIVVTYANTTDVIVSSEDEFGTPLKQSSFEDKDYYAPGEHKIVSMNRSLNFYGTSGTKNIPVPSGYRLAKYDYDKIEGFIFEAILYENVVPVTKEENEFGEPLEKIDENDHKDNIYEIGEHVIIKIDREINIVSPMFFSGTTFEAPSVPGYELIDYGHDRSDFLEFQVFVYVNNKRVVTSDIDSFGEVLEKTKSL